MSLRYTLMLILLFGLVGAAVAHDATPEVTPAATAESEITPDATVEPEVTPDFEPTLVISLSDLGYNSLSVEGAFGTNQIYLSIPLTWQADHDARVMLHLQPSPLLRPVSSLTVFANNEPLTSVAFTGAETITTTFTIPARLIKYPGLQLRFEAYQRVSDDSCEDSNIPSQWVRILGDSQIAWAFATTSDLPRLEDLSNLVFSRGLIDGQHPVLFVLPDVPSDVTLTAAVRAAAGLAQLVRNAAYPVAVTTVGAATAEQLETSNVVLVGLPSANPLIAQLDSPLLGGDGLFATADDQLIPNEHGVVQVLVSPWNAERHVLLLSANAESGLETLGLSLVERTTLDSLVGNYAFVTGPLDVSQAEQPPPWTTPQTSFEQLELGARMVRGAGILSEYYSFYLAPGSMFGEGAALVLHGSESPVLANEDSYIATFINDIPLGAARTSDLNADGTLTFRLPAELLQTPLPQPINLRLEISNQVPHRECETVNYDNAWTYIDDSSYFAANEVKPALPSLQAFPYPFASSAPVGFVLPDTQDESALRAAVKLAFLLGFYTPTALDVTTLRYADLGSAPLETNLIILASSATPGDLDVLLAPLTNEETASVVGDLEPLDVRLYRALPEPLGLLYTTLRPASAEQAVLVIASAAAEGFDGAVDLLTAQTPPVGVQGTTALVQADYVPYVVDRAAFEKMIAPMTTPEATDQPESSAASTETARVSAADMSLLIIVVPIMGSLLLILIVWSLRSSNRGKP